MNQVDRWSAACDSRELDGGLPSQETALSGLVPIFPMSDGNRVSSAQARELGASILSGERIPSSEASR
jgi:hypothetical protein